MTNQPSFTFKIDRNKRHQIQVEEIKIDKSGGVVNDVLFTREYEQAIGIVKTIMKMQKKPDLQNGEYSDSLDKQCKMQHNDNKNNILLFAGQRGGGKTSAVTSFGKYLEHVQIEGFTFKCLPIVDPSYFDNNNNILKSVLTTMFRMATCKTNHNGNNSESSTTSHRELWSLFNKAFKTLGDMEKDDLHEYSLDMLNELGEASNMQATMQRLVDEFIRVLPLKSNCLVLMIDDLDMNVTYAAQMLEQIRKFLMLNHLIILVAANLDQLQNEMREFYSKAFQQTIHYTNSSLSVDVEDLATRYLLKVFPASRRIHLSNVTQYLINARLHIVETSESNNLYGEYEGKSLQQVVLTMIWERTRLLFVPKNINLLHPIIPSNLRDLSQFINFMLDMKKVECDANNGKLFKDEESFTLCQQNLSKFKNFFLNNWIPENLTYEEEILFKSTPKDVSEINKHFINAINVIGTKNKKRLMSREVDLEQIAKNADGVNIDRDIYTMVSPNDPRFVKANKISDIFNQPSNYSYGDLLLMIDKYETYFESDNDRRFINAVKIYYSIILFETMFFKSVDVKYNQSDWEKVQVDTIVPIQKLLGGTVYYPNYFEIVASRFFKQKGPSFDAKRAFYHKFTFIYEIRDILGNSTRGELERKTDFGTLIKENIHLLFFILYYGDVRPDRYDQKHIYDTTHLSDAEVDGARYATFDILSLFTNALNPLQTLRRVYNDLMRSSIMRLGGYKIEKIFNKLSTWGQLCAILNGGTNLSFSNSILPFYSIDVMLTYLRKTYDDVEIICACNDQMLRKHKSNDIKLLKLLDETNKYLRNNVITATGIIDILKATQIASPSGIMRKFEINNTMLFNLYELKKKIYAQVDNLSIQNSTEFYKDNAISLVYNNENLTEKERNGIVKRIHGFQTVAEIYNYMCEVLIKDAVMEMVVKRSVQEQIREKKSILNYYNKLWDLTEQAINRIKVDKTDEKNTSTELSSVYRSIYQIGIDVFING